MLLPARRTIAGSGHQASRRLDFVRQSCQRSSWIIQALYRLSSFRKWQTSLQDLNPILSALDGTVRSVKLGYPELVCSLFVFSKLVMLLFNKRYGRASYFQDLMRSWTNTKKMEQTSGQSGTGLALLFVVAHLMWYHVLEIRMSSTSRVAVIISLRGLSLLL